MAKYKGVSLNRKAGISSTNNACKYQAYYKGKRSLHRTEKGAAIWYDKKLIEDGKEPVNILKRK